MHQTVKKTICNHIKFVSKLPYIHMRFLYLLASIDRNNFLKQNAMCLNPIQPSVFFKHEHPGWGHLAQKGPWVYLGKVKKYKRSILTTTGENIQISFLEGHMARTRAD
jgi:hypothetical protein